MNAVRLGSYSTYSTLPGTSSLFLLKIYIFQQKSLAGSCGGLGSIGIEKACNCENPCEKRKERERKAAEQKQVNSGSIDVKNI